MMANARSKTRAVSIEVSRQDFAIWTCAAALEPVPPTWLGPMWRDILESPVEFNRFRMTLNVPTRFIARYCTRDEREQLSMIIPHWLTEQALVILERHGLQPIPLKYTREPEPEDEIPF